MLATMMQMKSEHLIHMKAKSKRLKYEMQIAKAESESLRSERQKAKSKRLKSEMKITKAKSKCLRYKNQKVKSELLKPKIEESKGEV